MFQFDSDPIPIPRTKQLSAETFELRYRNKHPVILHNFISNWLPMTKWTIGYLQKALEHEYNQSLQVFVSHDNQLFINHPEVTRTITSTPEEFLSNVFDCEHMYDSPATAVNVSGRPTKQRYYLRTFSMPKILFEDINVSNQIKSLLDIVCYMKEKGPRNKNSPGAEDGYSTVEEQTAEDHVEFSKNGELLSPWEEMLSPPCSHTVSNKSKDGVAAAPAPVHTSPISSSIDEVPNSHFKKSPYFSDVNATQKCVHCHSDNITQLECKEMSSRIFNQSTMQLWIGTQGNVTPLHYDRNHGLLAQIIGKKELILFSHEDTQSLYPHVSYSERAHVSRINLRRLDAKGNAQFPKLRSAQPYKCILEPGELLYMPPFWWHDVTSLDNCISVTLPWDMSCNDPVPSCMLT